MNGKRRQRHWRISRRALHVAIALLLVFCFLSPFLESAINWNDSVFATGYDTESTSAILLLLLELVLSFAGLLLYFCWGVQWREKALVARSLAATELTFRITIPEISPPPPLRI
jgi:hypothetical protein